MSRCCRVPLFLSAAAGLLAGASGPVLAQCCDDDRRHMCDISAYMPKAGAGGGLAGRATTDDTRLWPGGVVPFEFDPGVSAQERADFILALVELEGACNVTFVPRTTEANYMYVKEHPDGSNNSPIGMRGGAQNVQITSWDDLRIVMHEVMHSLGFYHEQSHTNRDTYLTIHEDAIDPASFGNYNRVDTAATYGPYDLASIMHYPDTNFNIDGRRTFSVNQPFARDWQNLVGRTEILSIGDKRALVAKYGGTPPPGEFELIAPLGVAVGTSWTPEFDWAVSPDAMSYRLLVDDNPRFSSPEIDQTLIASPNPGYTHGATLAPNTVFYWTVEARNMAGQGAASPYPLSRGVFYTANGVPPILHVDDDAAAGGTGASWTTPISDLARATEIARFIGDVTTIRVAQGTYKPDAGTGDRERTFELADGVAMRGGFAGMGAPMPSVRNPGAFPTILTGDLAGDDDLVGISENSHHVVSGLFISDATLDGFTIEGGFADRVQDFRPPDIHTSGGGLLLDGCTNVTVSDCVFRTNASGGKGGGVFVSQDSGSTIVDCLFDENAAISGSRPWGGGLALSRDGDTIVDRCVFIGNRAAEGAAVLVEDAGAQTIANSLFDSNTGTGDFGGAICARDLANLRVAGVTMVNNVAAEGSALGLRQNAYVNLSSSIIWDQASPTITTRGDSIVDVFGSTTPSGSHDVVSGAINTTNRLNTDPMFVDAANGDYTLQSASPCIDAGDNRGMPLGLTMDIAGNARYQDDPAVADTGVNGSGFISIMDMGAFESLGNVLGIMSPGDTCSDAIPIGAGTTMGDLTGYLPDLQTGLSCGTVSLPGADIWYVFTPPMDGDLQVNTCGTNDAPGVDLGFDTVVSLHSACGEDDFGCNQDWVGGLASPPNACSGIDGGSETSDSAITRSVLAGQEVLIRVGSSDTRVGIFNLNVIFTPGELCSNPIPIDIGTTFGDLTGYRADDVASGVFCNSGSISNEDIWYTFTAPTAGEFQANTCGTNDAPGVDLGMDTVLSLHDGCDGDVLACTNNWDGPNASPPNACAGDDTGVIGDSSVTENVTAGQEVLIRVSYDTTMADGAFILNVIFISDEPGDLCSTAIPITDGTTFGSLATRTNGGSATCGGTASQTNPDEWFIYTAAANGELQVNTCGTNDAPGQDAGMDTVLALFDACDGAQLGCNDDWTQATASPANACSGDDAGNLRDSSLATAVTAGQDVLIRVTHFGTDMRDGAYTLNITLVTPSCPCELDGAPGVNVFDLLAYLDLWFAADAGADIDGTAGVNVFDLLFFLDCWFPASAGAPCP